MNKIKTLLTELLYDKIDWRNKSLNIYLITANIVPNLYLIYYLDIILII